MTSVSPALDKSTVHLNIWGFGARHKIFCVATVLLFTLIVVAVLAPWLAPYDPQKLNFAHKLRPPSFEHLFGTDSLGHDIFSQVLAGASLSLMIATGIVAASIIIGTPLGAISGYYGGWVDHAVMRVCDMFLAFPPLLLPIAISAALGPSIPNMICAIASSWFPWYARIARAAMMRTRNELYVSAAKSMGLSDLTILVRHCLPNSLTPIVVQGAIDFGAAILTAASLSFVGVGARPPAIEWGLMVSLSKATFLDHWWTATFPGLAIAVTVLLINLFADGLRDILDPRHSESS
ncbi:ABC transporter permease subunit [Sinorhizobium medicae]|uniref:ABC transporter permease n=1 Tax=Sinorhizobium medicae TaxID=110321 RepID=UPI001296FF9F|nr:ABC transporter permease [Sinorhizobium medicae]MQW02009.1 ABC transporter permease subunit [Sinorhizobium medicae]